ncbi:GntR family transcriptional regulator [Paenibacillus dendritiformis]|uniref:MocR-like pyridoxine biosynthesis transcription factor PdxR n=1 Tax=Paenibacillus dendritiformis TaxID=130049 RepID=UPI0018CED33E|nr:PLP-dependent aminotransferase family protein [Paenibacillus dendritiformis]MBG9795085.1 GntR family transcriptional regulator [Paenibacillus dendritiformis]
MVDLIPYIDEQAGEAKYEQICRYMKRQILSGAIPAGTRLPSIRQLAESLHLSRNTVEAAYQQLQAEGYADSRPRAGLFVCELESDAELPPPSRHREASPPADPAAAMDYEIDFRHGNIDVGGFPLPLWRKLSNDVWRLLPVEALQYGERQGEPGLRKQIAAYVRRSRGVVCEPEQVVIGAGIQQLLMLISQMIASERRTVALENPGYDGAWAIFRNHGLRLVSVPMEQDGLNVGLLKASGAEAVYITPSHQFPCGMVMPVAKRLRLLQWAEERDGLIIEDDYDGEFRYHAKPIPALQGLDSGGRVIYMGTFSKSLLPSIRVSYMVLPPALLERYRSDFAVYEQTASKLHQLTLERFMEEGHWDRHVRKIRKIYRKKHAALLAAVKRTMGGQVRVIGQDSGLHVLLRAGNGMTEAELLQAAARVGVKVYPTSNYWGEGADTEAPTLLLGFGGVSEHEIEDGIGRLYEAWFAKG